MHKKRLSAKLALSFSPKYWILLLYISVLSMLSTIQNVKDASCQPGSEVEPPPGLPPGDPVKKEMDPVDQPAGAAPATTTTPTDPEQGQRRKQRNPKPCFTAHPSEPQQTGGPNSINGDTEETKNGDPESPQDLSSMVKVEMIEGEPASTSMHLLKGCRDMCHHDLSHFRPCISLSSTTVSSQHTASTAYSNAPTPHAVE